MTDVFQRERPQIVCPPEPRAAELVTFVRRHLNEAERERLSVGACSYGHALRAHFDGDHDPSQVLGERNVFRYQPCSPMLIRVAAGGDAVDALLACAAARTVAARFELSLAEAAASARPYLAALPGVTTQVESAASCAARVAGFARVRAIGAVEPELLTATEAALVHVTAAPVLLTGRIELLRYVREQSVSHRYHRYGSLAAAGLLAPLRAPALSAAARDEPAGTRAAGAPAGG
jgi:RHH-type proline utilization regulon transcriptional repressor/proline dehydrogenase/delta 1-pyrroline-5-carboxylate dehydrogenase